MNKLERMRIDHVIDLVESADADKQIHTCLALSKDRDEDELTARYGKFFSQNEADFWYFDCEEIQSEKLSWQEWMAHKRKCRLLMLELFKIAEKDTL